MNVIPQQHEDWSLVVLQERTHVSAVRLLIKDSRSHLYLCADGTWCDDPSKALKFATAQAGVAYLRSRELHPATPQLVWKGERTANDWVMWPRPVA
jgi:hypothetical protein